MTTTAFPRTTSRFSLGPVLTSVITTLIVFGIGVFAFWIATYPAAIGYGGDVVPFIMGLCAVFALAILALLVWVAADDSWDLNVVVRVILILMLMLGSGLLTAWGFSLNSWDQSQFWLGTAVLGLVAVASGLIYVHKKFL